MRLVRHPDAAAFAAVALPYLAVDPARHTITLTMLDGLLRSGAPPALAMTLHEDDVLVGAVLRRADRGILVSGLPPRYAGVVAAALAGTQLPGAVGPVAEAEAFAEAWTAPVQHRFDQRLFALGTLTFVCSTEITAMLASRIVPRRSRWAETSSFTSTRWSCTSRR